MTFEVIIPEQKIEVEASNKEEAIKNIQNEIFELIDWPLVEIKTLSQK